MGQEFIDHKGRKVSIPDGMTVPTPEQWKGTKSGQRRKRIRRRHKEQIIETRKAIGYHSGRICGNCKGKGYFYKIVNNQKVEEECRGCDGKGYYIPGGSK